MKMDERESKLSPDKVIWEPMWDPKDGDIEKMSGKGIKNRTKHQTKTNSGSVSKYTFQQG